MNASFLHRARLISAGLVGAAVLGLSIAGISAQDQGAADSLLKAEAVPEATPKESQSEEEPRANYFPNTESLGVDEMRVTALGKD